MRIPSFERLRRTVKLTTSFFGTKAILLGLVPLVYFFLQWRLGLAGVGKLRDMILLAASYAAIGCVVFVWKLVVAGRALREEKDEVRQIEPLLGQLNESGQHLLLKLCRHGKMNELGARSYLLERRLDYMPEILAGLANRTGLLCRDSVGYFEVIPERREVVQRLLKKKLGRKA